MSTLQAPPSPSSCFTPSHQPSASSLPSSFAVSLITQSFTGPAKLFSRNLSPLAFFANFLASSNAFILRSLTFSPLLSKSSSRSVTPSRRDVDEDEGTGEGWRDKPGKQGERSIRLGVGAREGRALVSSSVSDCLSASSSSSLSVLSLFFRFHFTFPLSSCFSFVCSLFPGSLPSSPFLLPLGFGVAPLESPTPLLGVFRGAEDLVFSFLLDRALELVPGVVLGFGLDADGLLDSPLCLSSLSPWRVVSPSPACL